VENRFIKNLIGLTYDLGSRREDPMTIPETAVALYNYEAFMGGESDFMAFRSKLPVGSPAPDFTAVALDSGDKVQLRD
tara:strand:- start:1165 stop:1398 length:234 start_codon:yes stop_codon:yes gene_type:complete